MADDPLMAMYGVEPGGVGGAAASRSARAAEKLKAKSHQPEMSHADTLAGQGGLLASAEQAAVAAQPVVGTVPQGDRAMAEPGVGDPQMQVLGGQVQENYDQGLADVMMASQRNPYRFAPNKNYEDVMRHAATTRQLSEEQRGLALERESTEEAMARERAGLMGQAYREAAQSELRDTFIAEQQARKRQEVEDNMQRYAGAIDKATEEFRRVEQFDPGKAWADKSAGTKLRIGLAAIGRGLQGGNPQEVFNSVLERELKAHRQMRADASGRLTAARDNMSNALQQQQQFLAMSNDERVQDALVRASTARKMKAQMEAMEARWGPQLVTEKWSEMQNILDQKIADTELQLRIVEETTPKGRWVGGGYKHDKLVRDYLMDRGKARTDAAGEAQKAQSGIQKGMAEVDAKTRAKSMLENTAGPGGYSQNDQRILEKYYSKDSNVKREGLMRTLLTMKKKYVEGAGGEAPAGPVRRQIAEMTGGSWGGQEAREFYHDLQMGIADTDLKYWSGANSPDAEVGRELESLMSGINNPLAGGFDNFETNIDRLISRVEMQQRSATKMLPKHLQEKVGNFTGEGGADVFTTTGFTDEPGAGGGNDGGGDGLETLNEW